MALNIPRMRARFEGQFEATDQGGYLYRRGWKAAAIPVTAEERDGFVRQYVLRIYMILSVMVVAVTVLLGVSILLTDHRTAGEVAPIQLFVGIAAISLVATALLEWIYRSPSRELEGRAPVIAERSDEELRAIIFKRTTYGRLAAIALVGGASVTYIIHGDWDRRWIVLPPAVVFAAAVQAFRKWRFERKHPET